MSFQLAKATEYAILLLVSLNRQKPLSLRQISKQKQLPLKFLEKIAGQLKNKGLIISKEGVTGGYLLDKSTHEISLRDIIEAIEGKKGLVGCIHGVCSLEKNCFHKKIWQRLQLRLETDLKNIKLTNLIE